MRHRRKGRVLGRNPAHRRALFRNMASALFLTERETDENDENAPAVKGRIITTLAKAKEIRPLVEKCITIAKRALPARESAAQYGTDAERNSSEWQSWRRSDRWRQWSQAMAPVVTARRRLIQLLGDKQAARLVFEVAPRFQDRPGGYTRVVKLAKPRLGDAGPRAILEFVGVRDRATRKAQAPTFESSSEPAGAES